MFDFSPPSLIARAIVLLVAMDVHEFAHAYFAYLNGDSTAKDMGKMSLNPVANIFLPGYVIGVLFGFGYLGSVPVNSYRMRDPRWGTFQAVLAGPVSNLLLAAVFAVPLRFGLVTSTPSSIAIFPSLYELLGTMVYFNLLLFLLNLIPLSPLDGWTIVLAALPASMAVEWQRYRQVTNYMFYGLILLLFLGLGALIFQPICAIQSIFTGGAAMPSICY